MAQFKSTVDILKLLEKSNCRACGLPSCLVFALSVYKGEKSLRECPRIDPETVRNIEGENNSQETPETPPDPGQESVEALQEQIAEIDLGEAAKRAGGRYDGRRLTLKILGKDFSVDPHGQMVSDIHINPWIALPILEYILTGKGLPPTGNWVPLRELRGGLSWQAFFTKRCETPLKQVADTYPDFFKDLIELFNGKPVADHYQSDVSLVLHPLPKLPLLVCYWKPDEGLPSSLNLFFDTTADDNLSIGAIYRICAGLATMFEKITHRHGH